MKCFDENDSRILIWKGTICFDENKIPDYQACCAQILYLHFVLDIS